MRVSQTLTARYRSAKVLPAANRAEQLASQWGDQFIASETLLLAMIVIQTLTEYFVRPVAIKLRWNQRLKMPGAVKKSWTKTPRKCVGHWKNIAPT